MKKADYNALTVHLTANGADELILSFEEVAGIVGELPPSAYSYYTPWSSDGSLGKAALRAGYKISLNGKNATFYKVRANYSKSPQNLSSMQVKLNATLDIKTAIASIRKYHETTNDEIHTRYRSWAHCYNAFQENRSDVEKTDYLCLHLAWYLASWGMLRNSFLLNRDYLVHKPLVTELISDRFEPLFQSTHTPDMIPLTLEASREILRAYKGNSVTSTLITKILLGVFGCAPAYDNFFRYAVKKYKVCSGSWGERSLRSLWQYYEHYRDEFELIRNELTIEGLQYTPMKLLDMCLWQIGFNELER